MDKRVYRSTTNKVIGGVCGGLGEYFEVDPVFIRVVAVILALATGVGFLAYIIAWIIIPQGRLYAPGEIPANAPTEAPLSSWNKYIPGMLLIGVGAVVLISDHWWWFDWDKFWPVVLIVVGLFLLLRRKRDPRETNENPMTGNNPGSEPDNGGALL